MSSVDLPRSIGTTAVDIRDALLAPTGRKKQQVVAELWLWGYRTRAKHPAR
jgi:hypothetical protein